MCCNSNVLTNKKFIQYVSKDLNIKSDNKIRIKDILNDNWDDFVAYSKDNNLTIRDVVFHEVERVRACGCMSEGYYTFICKDCNELIYSPFHCHSRFCSSCGVANILKKTDMILSKLVKAPHRHIIFTIPDELRNLFQQHRSICFNILFDAVRDTLNYTTHKFKKSENFSTGFISCLHTFGRDLKFNPHIHVLFCEYASGISTIYRKIPIFYEQLRKSFQHMLLSKLEKHFGKKKFRALKNKIYSHTQFGFYVYAKENFSLDAKSTSKYIIRYCCRPAIAESRIIYYDGTTVKFWYDRHEDGKRVIETLHVFEFIKLLIIHIPDKGFNMIRYYGFYCRPLRLSNKLLKLFNKNYFKAKQCINSWRNRLRFYFDYDPLICKFCGKKMILDSITIKGKIINFNTC